MPYESHQRLLHQLLHSSRLLLLFQAICWRRCAVLQKGTCKNESQDIVAKLVRIHLATQLIRNIPKLSFQLLFLVVCHCHCLAIFMKWNRLFPITDKLNELYSLN